jgi:hypothetical protein
MPKSKRASMSRTDWILVVAFITGFLLFLYGANLTIWSGSALNSTESAIIGYCGVYLFIGTIAAYLLIYIYKELKKKSAC